MKKGKNNSPGKGSRRTTQSRRPNKTARNRPARSGHLHLYSNVETTLTLKSKPTKREKYPIKIADLFNEASIGADTDIRMVGYHLDIVVASGNNCSTVSANISHSGPWVRASTAMDGFNQQFVVRPLSRSGKVTFSKRVLPRSEREYLSPHTGDNYLNLQIDDPCGVIPGATLRIKCRIHFIRPHLPTKLVGADSQAIDLYEDQDVASGNPAPPVNVNDVPRAMRIVNGVISSDAVYTTSTTSPFIYTFPIPGGPPERFDTYTVTVGGTYNIVGEFTHDSSKNLQTDFTQQGFEGTIVKS